MAHVKGSGTVKQQSQRNRRGKRRGIKKYGGEKVIAGNIILKQVGAKVKPGNGVGMGRDYTIFAVKDGQVKFTKRHGKTVANVV